ncbi:MAG: MBOAT family protein [Nannocystis sp.]|nr:MBOAT family protein [Nannocystis sp.]
MVFASLVFLYVFLPLNLWAYYALRRADHRNLLLIAASLLFYAWGEPIWVVLLLISSALDYAHALIIERHRGRPWARAALISSLVTNLGLLGAFKYSGLLADALNASLGLSLAAPRFALPLGISFYTFQALSYVVDVYRGEAGAQRSYLKFLLYLSLYPQLVAGPIVRYVHIARAIERRAHHLPDIAAGVDRLCAGLFKKVCVANVAGELVVRTMDVDPSALSVAEGWFGLLMFSLQIYFDFSGYSDMAIGLGLLFGFRYHENFNYPYIARSAADFWRRWHISLGSFFRDYLYIPLGGNRRWPLRNLLIVWALTGLWHGASLNFVLWGLYFGLLIALERLLLQRLLDALPALFGHLYLLFVAVLGWAIFYFEDLERLSDYLALLFGQSDSPRTSPALLLLVQEHAYWLALALLLCAPIMPRLGAALRAWAGPSQRRSGLLTAARGLANLLLLLTATAMLVGRTYNPFIYFRF